MKGDVNMTQKRQDKEFEENRKKEFAKKLCRLISDYEKKTQKKLSQQQLADFIPVARETISYWTNGKSYPGEDAIDRLCAFFGTPPNYFSVSQSEDGLTLLEKGIHDKLQRECEQTAHHIELGSGFYAFIKENPALADVVVGASWVDAILQSCSPDVPAMPDHTFQIEGRAGVKIYPPAEVLYMLAVVQRDLKEYALFLLQKWSKVIHESHDDLQKRGEITETDQGYFDASGREYIPACERFSLELRGHGSLTPRSSLLVQMYDQSLPQYQKMMLDKAHDVFRESRKEDPKAQKVRAAARRARMTGKTVNECLNEETED